MSHTVHVKASKEYDVIIENNAYEKVCEYIKNVIGETKGVRAVIVTDSVVKQYVPKIKEPLNNIGIEADVFVIPNGEKSKNTTQLVSLLEFMARGHITRGDIIIALGGGVVGDLTGFAAAVYMRGIRFIQLPTTLLAMVDSSVGGKTAVDLEAGKNLAGAFYQPEVVVCDTATLKTLLPETFRDGCAEVIKYAVLQGKGEVLDILSDAVANSDKGGALLRLEKDDEALERLIAGCVEIKRDVVGEDEFDRGTRQLLNLGHTIGHAVEAVSEYEITHGSAVSIGLASIARACNEMGICSDDCLNKIIWLLEGFGLPTTCDFPASQLYEIMLSDKKRGGDSITLVLPHEFGECELRKVKVEELKDFIK